MPTLSTLITVAALWLAGSLGLLALWLAVWWGVGRLTGWSRGAGDRP